MQQLRIVWAAMPVSQLMFAFVAWYAVPPSAGGSLELAIALGVMSVVPAGLSVAWGRVIAPVQSPAPLWVVRWAFAEAVTLFGLVSFFVGGPALIGGSLMAIGFLLILAQPPVGVKDVHVVDEVRTVETVDRDERVDVVRQQLRIPAEDGEPPIGVERTVRPSVKSGPPVVLVHGLAQNRFSWRISGRSFSAYLASRGYEVLNVELRGHGLSRAWGAGNARGFEEYVTDLRRVVDRCRSAPFVIGHSLGGAVGVAVATERRLRGLIHLAGVFGFAGSNRTLRALCRATIAVEPLMRAAPVRVRTGWAGEWIARLYSVTDIAGYVAPIAGWFPDSIERELLAERLSLGFDWTSAEIWLQMSRWALGEPFGYAERFAGLELPLLVMAGDADPLVRVEDARLCYTSSGSSDKELVVFDPFDHEVHWGHIDLILGRRAPEFVWPRIEGWLRRRSG